MPFSKISELVVSSSAVPYLPGSQIWGKSKMENGFVCIQLPQMSSTNALNRLEQSSNNWVLSGGSKHSITKLKCVKPVLRHAAKVKALLSRAAIDQQSLTFEAEGQSCSDFDMLGVHSRELSSPLFATKDDSALLCSAEFEKQALLTASSAIGNGSNKDAHGLDALIRFVPESARQHCLDGLDPHMLAENRNVAILFMIVDTQVRQTATDEAMKRPRGRGFPRLRFAGVGLWVLAGSRHKFGRRPEAAAAAWQGHRHRGWRPLWVHKAGGFGNGFHVYFSGFWLVQQRKIDRYSHCDKHAGLREF